MSGTRLILARHGETDLNVHGRFRGRANPALTSRGHEQARALAAAVAVNRPTRLITSPRRRAQETAREIAVVAACPAEIEPRLDDIDYGAWTGRSRFEVATAWADELHRWHHAPDDLTIPGGETVRLVADRVMAALESCAARSAEQTVVLVTHDVTIRLAICRTLGAPLAAMHRIQVGLASMTTLTYGEGFVVEGLNDRCHLAGPGAVAP